MSYQKSHLNTFSYFFPSECEHFSHSLTDFTKQEPQHNTADILDVNDIDTSWTDCTQYMG
jgi:hypothetical protein